MNLFLDLEILNRWKLADISTSKIWSEKDRYESKLTERCWDDTNGIYFMLKEVDEEEEMRDNIVSIYVNERDYVGWELRADFRDAIIKLV